MSYNASSPSSRVEFQQNVCRFFSLSFARQIITHSHVRQCLYPVLMYSEQWRMYVEANTGNIGLGTSYRWKKKTFVELH